MLHPLSREFCRAGGTRYSSAFCLFFLITLWAGLAPVRAADQPGVVITDEAGRSVTVPARVNRIVALGGALRFVTYLQAVDLVAGVEALEKKPLEAGRLYGLAVAEKVRDLPVIGEGGPGGKLPDFEKMIAVRPDLIVAVGLDSAQVKTIQDKAGIPVVSLGSGGMGILDLKQTRQSLSLLGRLLGRAERAEELNAYIDGLEQDLRRRTADRQDRPTAYVGGIGYRGKHGITSTDANYAPLAWIDGHNVADAVEQSGRQSGHVFIDQEKLLLWNPDVIFLDAGGIDKVRDDYGKNPAFYGMLKAFQNDRVWVMPPYNSYHTNIETALANAYFLGKILYPEAFADIEPATKADAIFDFFIGVKAYDRLQQELYGYGRAVFGKDGVRIH
jgi:iron complex transport system substrate-binding protein